MASWNSTGIDEDQQVLVEERRFARILTLNRPKQLNAISFTMVSRLLELFSSYETDPSVKLVVVKGKGRAFCAGGDVSAAAHAIKESEWRKGAYFFRKQYTLNYLLATSSKPQVSLLNGIVMGGGAGVSIHGRFRVATEKSIFAMPETSLGHFPDVGASYYLPRLRGFFGEYVGLTGARLDGAEMLACGLATHFVPSERLTQLEEALCRADTSQPSIISAIIDKFSRTPILHEQSAYNRLDVIDKCFSRRTVEDILAALEEEALKKKDDWIDSTIRDLKKASPTSLKISLRSIREGRLQDAGQCLIREYRMACHVMRGEVSEDFIEGCRALLLDKDRNPKWEPSKLELVTDAMVERYFSRIEDEEWEDLKLTARPNLPASATSKL
ncbi:3-hydroxyisobutyryl-CoA hydrolase 1-like isoform X1 [Cucurbita moschata]|uniref:3-hydroxyisobutyryl-CoA hydrolase n=1 Tax=Cucurbita moschata TaxID=3662 RepID=A0A6J1H642_CUCMO|nr:3-hydroxyisobutyryl-CoA hydrolase 1-like isoform X1 [Cucurbita moschata]XP_022960070.1 3-hydroxyisobutyryl-CoA hydrolase 1-like isoform X1 [Cucurbita moschata]